ncbi:protein PXR1 [Rosa rugosa]|uniref:protein PXR1 n=1 Tax=Rosa rugosa TaxID=74645 RepID=UPI002B40FF96|nr:protein PXR1 [Rosa rugosa]XP_062016914.1 protein PXR1 [Rosa rugosa]
MKTVQSRILSSDPISLSDATSFLSDFNRSVCGGGGGASHETCWFVRRALASFEELEQLYRKLKDPRSDRKGRHPGSETRNDDVETTVGQSFVASRDVSAKPKSHRQRESDDVNRKVEVEEQSKGGNRNLMEDGGEIAERVGVEIDDKKKKKKKKKKREEDGESEMGNGEVKREIGFRDFEQDESQNKKKKKKKRDNVDENWGGVKEEDGESEMGSEEVKRQEKKKKKKRKSEVLVNGEIDALEEQQEKRKKRRKS